MEREIPKYPQIKKLSRLITRLESGQITFPEILEKEKIIPGDSYTVGLTGPPGAGKSTLSNRLISLAREDGNLVGMVSVDPSSPFTGGAVLGDRIRMLAHSKDSGVFIRSMAARKALGGLAPATGEVIKLINLFGFNLNFIETVGVGQSEVDVMNVADTVILVTVAGVGDTIQTLKAGLMEIGDILVVNMADRPEVHKTVVELKSMQASSKTKSGWKVPIIETIATSGKGVDQLWEEIKKHKKLQESSDLLKRKRQDRYKNEVLEIVGRKVYTYALEQFNILPQQDDPYQAADLILQKFKNNNMQNGNI